MADDAKAKATKAKQAEIGKIKNKLKGDVSKLTDVVDILNGRKPLVNAGKLKGQILNPKSDDKNFEQFIQDVENGFNTYPGQPKDPYGKPVSQRPRIKILQKKK